MSVKIGPSGGRKTLAQQAVENACESKIVDATIRREDIGKYADCETPDIGVDISKEDKDPVDNTLSVGNPHGYVYLDVELEDVNNGSSAVKIALMTQNGNIFYGHITDDEELKKQNVLEGEVWRVYGSKKTVAAQFNFWMNEYLNSGLTQCVQFVCNVSTYKFPAFIDVITNGEGIKKLQSWFTPVCYDLTIDICNAISMFTPGMKEYPLQSAFLIDNKELLYKIKPETFTIKTDEKVLNDLVITSILHKFIWNLV